MLSFRVSTSPCYHANNEELSFHFGPICATCLHVVLVFVIVLQRRV